MSKDSDRLSRLMLDEFGRLHGRFDNLTDQVADLRDEVRALHRQIDVLEKASRNFAGFAKEIDHLFGRITAIETHLGLHHDIAA